MVLHSTTHDQLALQFKSSQSQAAVAPSAHKAPAPFSKTVVFNGEFSRH